MTQDELIVGDTAGGLHLEAALEIENRTRTLANGSEDAAEARRVFLEKRRPVWTGR